MLSKRNAFFSAELLTDFFAHWRHILPSYPSPFCIAYEEAQGIIFSDNKDERIGDAAVSDLGSSRYPIHILDTLSFCAVCLKMKLSMISTYD